MSSIKVICTCKTGKVFCSITDSMFTVSITPLVEDYGGLIVAVVRLTYGGISGDQFCGLSLYRESGVSLF